MNGQVERDVCSVMDKARTLMASANVPMKYWEYAILTACYIINRTPSANMNVTPYEKVTGEKPNLSKLVPFFAIGVFHRTKEERIKDGAWAYKAELCRMLGYDESCLDSYYILVIKSGRIITRGNCKFSLTTKEIPVEDIEKDIFSTLPEYTFDDDNDDNDNNINNNNLNNNNNNNNDNEEYDLENPYWTSDDNYNYASGIVTEQDTTTDEYTMQVDYNNNNYNLNNNLNNDNKTSYDIATTSNITVTTDMPTTSNIMRLDNNNSYATSSVNMVSTNDTTADYIMQTDSINDNNINLATSSDTTDYTMQIDDTDYDNNYNSKATFSEYANVTYDNDIMLADININNNDNNNNNNYNNIAATAQLSTLTDNNNDVDLWYQEYSMQVHIPLALPRNPDSLQEALNSKEADKWRAAIDNEMEQFKLRNTFAPAEQYGRGMKTKLILKYAYNNDYSIKTKA
jgi:hypothetical protein